VFQGYDGQRRRSLRSFVGRILTFEEITGFYTSGDGGDKVKMFLMIVRAFMENPMKAATSIHTVVFAILFIVFTIAAAIDFLMRLLP
jgi:hypothetical protein